MPPTPAPRSVADKRINDLNPFEYDLCCTPTRIEVEIIPRDTSAKSAKRNINAKTIPIPIQIHSTTTAIKMNRNTE